MQQQLAKRKQRELMAITFHELRNPLNGTVGHLRFSLQTLAEMESGRAAVGGGAAGGGGGAAAQLSEDLTAALRRKMAGDRWVFFAHEAGMAGTQARNGGRQGGPTGGWHSGSSSIACSSWP